MGRVGVGASREGCNIVSITVRGKSLLLEATPVRYYADESRSIASAQGGAAFFLARAQRKGSFPERVYAGLVVTVRTIMGVSYPTSGSAVA